MLLNISLEQQLDVCGGKLEFHDVLFNLTLMMVDDPGSGKTWETDVSK